MTRPNRKRNRKNKTARTKTVPIPNAGRTALLYIFLLSFYINAIDVLFFGPILNLPSRSDMQFSTRF